MRTTYTLLLSFLCLSAWSQKIYQMPQGVKQSSISTFENPNGIKGSGGKTNKTGKGNAFEELKAGQSKTLLDLKGAGIIQRMWFTVQDRSPEMLRSMRLRIYWDGSTKAAVDVPFGDFSVSVWQKLSNLNRLFFRIPKGVLSIVLSLCLLKQALKW